MMLKKVITVRPTSFDVVAKEGGAGIVESINFESSGKSHRIY